MDSGKSISQGAFISLPPGFSLAKLRRRKKRKADEEEYLALWEISFLKIWNSVEKEMKEMNEKLFSKVLEDLVKHIGKLGRETHGETIPCELLLTGTNLPDHKMLLESLSRDLANEVTPHIATLWAGEAPTLKTAVQIISRQIMDKGIDLGADSEDSEDDLDDSHPVGKRHLQTFQLSFATLAAWYAENATTERPPVVIIVPDFESFSSAVLSDLIALLCSYNNSVPFILVLGVATSPSAVYQGLPRAVLSRLVVQLFHSEASPTFLNHVVETIFLSEKCPFKLGARTMTFLTDVFLFHSFSVQRFVQGFKYCMMEHFYLKDHFSLCCAEEELPSAAGQLHAASLEDLRKLASFQKHVESCDLPERKRLLLDDEYTKKFIVEKLKNLHAHASDFHIVLKCLNILSRDLPNTPLGRHVREVYCRAVSSIIVESKDYKQVLTLLGLQSRSELLAKIATILDLLKIDSIMDILSEEQNRFETAIIKLENLKRDMSRVGDDSSPQTNGDLEQKDFRKDLVSILKSDLLEPFLTPPTSMALHEVLYFEDLVAVRRRISGAPRSAIHTALNNPHHYLECGCCELPDLDAVIPTLPDLSIVYKLYLESNKTINLFDWLQSFATIMKPEDDGIANGKVDHQVQARFTRAVSELQFLGFIKPSKAKPDHVTRLTFGNF